MTAATSVPESGLQAHIALRQGDFLLDVRLEVACGETVALLGPNGAGKSTTVAALAGLRRLTQGFINLNAAVLDDPTSGIFVPPNRRRVGVVFQDDLLFPHMSALENVAFGLRSQGHPRNDARRSAQQWLDSVGISELSHRRPRALSGGQRQRVALARALATQPDLLLADEPLGALDISTRSRLRRMLSTHISPNESESGAPARLLITHDPTDAFVLADRICIIENGRITQTGTPSQIRRHPLTPYAADLAGINLLRGTANGGEVTIDIPTTGVTETMFTLHAADTSTGGPVLVTVHPKAIALHQERPSGSPRNVWHTTVDAVEPLGDITRVSLATPVPMIADVTPASATQLAITPGVPLWAAVKATELELTPESC